MPAGNPLGYIIPQIAPIAGVNAPAVDLNVLASLLGAQPTVMSAGASDIVRRGMAPVGPAPAPANNTPAARAPEMSVMDQQRAYISGLNAAELAKLTQGLNQRKQMTPEINTMISRRLQQINTQKQ